KGAFEFQRLHGMGEALHDIVHRREGTRCRIYAPVGAHEDLLAYLVRRLLENGANSSFVHQIIDEEVSAEEIARDPFTVAEANGGAANPSIPVPRFIFGRQRLNSKGWDITDTTTLGEIDTARRPFEAPYRWEAAPITSAPGGGAIREIVNPARTAEIVGTVRDAAPEQVKGAITLARAAQPAWAATPVENRAEALLRAADLYEANAG